MAGKWWKRIKNRLGGSVPPDDADEPDARETGPKAQWLPAEATPFGVPVLDLISVTGQMISTTGDPQAATTSMSWSRRSGRELDVSALDSVEPLPASLRYPADPQLVDGLLFTPGEMEHKWVVALREGELLIARSWTANVIVRARATRAGDELVIDEVRLIPDSGLDIFGDAIETIDWLIRTHALGQVLPLPVDEEGAALLESVPLAVFGPFGHMARCAARGWDPPPPPRPLRSDCALLQAIRAEDEAEIQRLLDAGIGINSPSPTMSFRPLSVAAIRKDLALLERLLAHGADPNLAEDNGLVPLGRAIVSGAGTELLDALCEAGARTDVSNDDGFNLLHATAETNRPELVDWMIAHGVGLEARTKHGHTPLHIACGLGHLEAGQALLRVGADPRAEAGGVDALAIARQEGKADMVELIEGADC